MAIADRIPKETRFLLNRVDIKMVGGSGTPFCFGVHANDNSP